MKVLITGSSGFIGSNLLQYFIEKKEFELSILLRKNSVSKKIQDVIEYRCDFFDIDSMKEAVSGKDIIIHIAGVTKVRNHNDFFKYNTEATKNLLNAVKEFNPDLKRFIYFSSLSAAGPSKIDNPVDENTPENPVSFYGKSKLQAEKIVKNSGIEYTIIRPPAVYGPGDKDIYIYFNLISKGIAPVLGSGKNQLSIVHVSDLVKGVYLVINKLENSINKIFYFSDGKIYNWLRLREYLKNIINPKFCIDIKVPLFLLKPFSLLGDITNKIKKSPTPLNSDKFIEMKQEAWICSIENAIKTLDFSPDFDIFNGFKETYEWYLKNGWIKTKER